MPSTKKFDLVAKIGEYSQGGETKARWRNCGAAFENEKGQLSIVLDSLPVGGSSWNGWFLLVPPNDQRTSNSSNANATSSSKDKSSAAKPESSPDAKSPSSNPDKGTGDSDDLPF